MVKKNKKPWLPYVILLPSFILIVMFTLYPLIKTVITSFSLTTEAGGFIQWVGTYHWKRMFESHDFLQVIKNTFQYAGMVLVMTFAGGMVLALLACQRGKGSRLYETLYLLPMVIASVPVSAIAIFFCRQDAGVINNIFGTSNAWLNSKDTAMVVVAIVSAWSHIATCYLFLMVGFRNVSTDLLEAATIDGAGNLMKIWKIMIPMASPQIFYVLFTTTVMSFKSFSQIKLLTNGGPAGATTNLIYAMYNYSRSGQMEKACCYALVLFVIIFLVTRIQFIFEKKFVHYQ